MSRPLANVEELESLLQGMLVMGSALVLLHILISRKPLSMLASFVIHWCIPPQSFDGDDLEKSCDALESSRKHSKKK